MERDLYSNVDDRMARNPVAITTNATTAGNIIDTRGYESLTYVVAMGTITDGSYSLLMQEGDDSGLSDVTTVPAEDTLGALTGFVATDDNAVKRVGSIGKKRYQRLSIVSTGVTAGVNMCSAIAILGHPKTTPEAQ